MRYGNKLRFEPTLDYPNRIPQGRFPFPIDVGDRSVTLLGCRHGLLLMLHRSQGSLKLLVSDPINGHEHPLAFPPGFDEKIPVNGAVLCAALGDIQNFQVVLVSTDLQKRVIACVYSSEAGEWGNLITTPIPPKVSTFYLGVIDPSKPVVLVGDSLYMIFLGDSPSIIEFDVDCQSLAVIPLPVGSGPMFSEYYSVMRAEDGGLGLLFVSAYCRAQLWKRKTDCDGVASWVPGRTIELEKLFNLDLQNKYCLVIRGYAEEHNVVFLWSVGGAFMIQLDSLQFKKLPEINLPQLHPFESVYAAGI